jgi:hypothetical protein
MLIFVVRRLFLMMLVVGFSANASPSWRGYDVEKINNFTAKTCIKNSTEPFSSEQISRMKLWPDLLTKFDFENGAVLFGASWGLEQIFRNQNPSNCSEAKYLISNGYNAGFGARIHVEGIGLAIAMQVLD